MLSLKGLQDTRPLCSSIFANYSNSVSNRVTDLEGVVSTTESPKEWWAPGIVTHPRRDPAAPHGHYGEYASQNTIVLQLP